MSMKKVISFILAVCFILLIGSFTWALSPFQKTDDAFVWDLCSVSEFSAELANEDVNVADGEMYDIYVLIEAKDILADNTFDVSNIPLDSSNIDDFLKKHREDIKKCYSTNNERIASALGLNEYAYYASSYSPYIEVVFDDLYEYKQCESSIIAAVENNKNLLSSVSSYAQIKMIPEATVDDSSYTTYYPITEAFDDIGVLNSQYTGNGVNVGIIDYNIPHTTANLKPDKYTILTPPRVGDENNDHGTLITSIIGGTSGIAEDVYFYCLTNSGKIIEDIESLLDYNVNIINICIGAGMVGQYTKRDACIDYIMTTSHCTVVKSAGNQSFDENKDNERDEDPKNFFISGLGCSMNAITVGAINHSHNLVESSCWNTLSPFLYKPDVVAPGGRLTGIPTFDDEDNPPGGTSCAAPMVTGTIALLMEEFPMLKVNPALVKSIIHLGAEKLPSQSDYFDQQAGFGLINYQNMRECLLNTRFYNFNILPTASEGDIVLSYTMTIPSLQQLRINANSIFKMPNPDAENSTIISPLYTNYTIKVFDLTSQTYVASSTINSSLDYLIYANESTTDSSVRIDIVLESNNVSGQEEKGALAFELVHEHCWEGRVYNELFHQFVCACGATNGTGRHYIYGSDHVGEDSAPCHACGYWLDLRDDFHNITMSVTKVSVNGSYILPNGIVVLVDEDIEAYLAGTLQFYHPDDLPVTQ